MNQIKSFPIHEIYNQKIELTQDNGYKTYMKKATGNHWLEYIELKMTIWSTHGDCNMVSHDLKYVKHDINLEIVTVTVRELNN